MAFIPPILEGFKDSFPISFKLNTASAKYTRNWSKTKLNFVHFFTKILNTLKWNTGLSLIFGVGGDIKKK